MTDRPGTRWRELPGRGPEGREVTVVVTVYRDRVWMAVEPLFDSDIAILYPQVVDRLIEILTWAAYEARRYGPGRV